MSATEAAFEACRLLKRFANGDGTTLNGDPSADQADYHRAVDFAEMALRPGIGRKLPPGQRKVIVSNREDVVTRSMRGAK